MKAEPIEVFHHVRRLARIEQDMGAFVAASQAAAQAGVRHLPTFSQEFGNLKLAGSQLTHRRFRSEEASFQSQRRSEQAREEVAAFHCGASESALTVSRSLEEAMHFAGVKMASLGLPP